MMGSGTLAKKQGFMTIVVRGCISTYIADMGDNHNNSKRKIFIERGQESPGLLKCEGGSKNTKFASG